MEYALWNNIKVTLGFDDHESMDFSVQSNKTGAWKTIYSGVALGEDVGASQLKYSVDITDIVRSDLEREFPFHPDVHYNSTQHTYRLVAEAGNKSSRIVGTYRVYLFYPSGGSSYKEVTVVPDWSYKNLSVGGWKHERIDTDIDYRQLIVFSNVGTENLEYWKDNSWGYIPANSDAVFVGERGFNMGQFYEAPVGTVFYSQPGVVAGQVISSCCRYALHYLNVHGAWDSLLIKGNARELFSVEHKEYTKGELTDIDPFGQLDMRFRPAGRGRVNYRNNITRKWELHTHWLTDEQSARMHNLLISPQVYIQDLEAKDANGNYAYEIIPVVISDTEMETKTYRNNGHNLVSYTINVESAQTEQR